MSSSSLLALGDESFGSSSNQPCASFAFVLPIPAFADGSWQQDEELETFRFPIFPQFETPGWQYQWINHSVYLQFRAYRLVRQAKTGAQRTTEVSSKASRPGWSHSLYKTAQFLWYALPVETVNKEVILGRAVLMRVVSNSCCNSQAEPLKWNAVLDLREPSPIHSTAYRFERGVGHKGFDITCKVQFTMNLQNSSSCYFRIMAFLHTDEQAIPEFLCKQSWWKSPPWLLCHWPLGRYCYIISTKWTHSPIEKGKSLWRDRESRVVKAKDWPQFLIGVSIENVAIVLARRERWRWTEPQKQQNTRRN